MWACAEQTIYSFMYKNFGYWILSLYSCNVSMALYFIQLLHTIFFLPYIPILDERLQQSIYYANYLQIQIGMNSNFTHQCIHLNSPPTSTLKIQMVQERMGNFSCFEKVKYHCPYNFQILKISRQNFNVFNFPVKLSTADHPLKIGK